MTLPFGARRALVVCRDSAFYNHVTPSGLGFPAFNRTIRNDHVILPAERSVAKVGVAVWQMHRGAEKDYSAYRRGGSPFASP